MQQGVDPLQGRTRAPGTEMSPVKTYDGAEYMPACRGGPDSDSDSDIAATESILSRPVRTSNIRASSFFRAVLALVRNY